MAFGINPFNAVSQMALATVTGGSSLIVSQIVRQVVSQIAQQIIQQLGQQMGLPQGVIDMAQGAAAGGLGDFQGAVQNYQEAGQSFAQQFFPDATPQEQGQIQSAEDQIRESMSNWVAQSGGGQDEDGNPRGLAAGRAGGGQSWLMALAKALGSQLNAAQNELERTMDGTNWKEAGQVAEFQAQSQQFALFMNTATNVIKTVGESLSTMARKQ